MNVKMLFEDVTINTRTQLDRYQHSEGIFPEDKAVSFSEHWYASDRPNFTASQNIITCS